MRKKTQIQDILKAYQIKGKIRNKTCRPIVALYYSNKRGFLKDQRKRMGVVEESKNGLILLCWDNINIYTSTLLRAYLNGVIGV